MTLPFIQCIKEEQRYMIRFLWSDDVKTNEI